MRIAYVHTGQWPSNSPSMTFSTMTAKALAETTECCHFFIQRNSDFSSEEIFEKYFNLSQPENLFIYQYHKSNLLNSNHSYFIKVFNKITKLIKDDMLDAVISRNATFLPYLACIKKRYNINVFYETHNFYVDISIRNDLRKKKIKYSIGSIYEANQCIISVRRHELRANSVGARRRSRSELFRLGN